MTNLEMPSEVAATESQAAASEGRSWVRKTLDRLYYFSALSGALSVLAVLVLMLAQVAFRQTGHLLRGGDDLTAWACAAAVFLPLAYTFRQGELVRMGLIIDAFRGRKRRALELFSLVSAAALVAYALFWAATLAYQAWLVDDRAQGLLAVPMWIPQSSMTIGLFVLLIALLDELVVVLQGRTPAFDRAARQRREAGDFSGEL